MEVSLQHIIGTAALIGLVISTGFFYTIFTSVVQDESRKQELRQISETVALNIEEMINLAKFSKYSSEYLVKIIDLPIDLAGRTYKIQLVEDPLKGFYVHTFLANQKTVSAHSTIPYNSGDIPIKFETTETAYTIQAGADNLEVVCAGTIYGKNGTAVWANLDWSSSNGDAPNQIMIGIGWVGSKQVGG